MLKTRTGCIALSTLLMLPALVLVGCAAEAAEAPVSAPTSTKAPAATPQNEAAQPVWPNDRCRDEQLAGELVDRAELSVEGKEGFAIVLTNVSEQACSYNGHPGMLLLGADGTLFTSSGDRPLDLFDFEPGALAPGESVQVEGQLTAVETYGCTPTTATTVRVLVSSDGAGPGIDVPSGLQVCGDARSDLATGPLTPAS